MRCPHFLLPQPNFGLLMSDQPLGRGRRGRYASIPPRPRLKSLERFDRACVALNHLQGLIALVDLYHAIEHLRRLPALSSGSV